MRAIILAAVLAAISLPASGQGACVPRDVALRNLSKDYGEAVIARGIAGNGGLMAELLVNETTGTWSIIAVQPSKMACFIASGDGWQTVKPEPTAEPSL